jgi:hypothetical protein
MKNLKKILIGTTIGAGVIGLVSYLSKLKRTGAELESVVKTNVHSFNAAGLTARIDVKLKNPTDTSLKLKFPFVKVIYKQKEKGTNKVIEKVIGTSKVIDKDITIPKYGEANITGIMITIPTTELLSLAGGLLNLLTKKQAVPITVKTITTIDLGWKKIPYSKSDDMTLKPKQA